MLLVSRLTFVFVDFDLYKNHLGGVEMIFFLYHEACCIE